MSKLFSSSQLRTWDQFTIANQSITSTDLMERAAKVCVAWLSNQWPEIATSFAVFCGCGNNGGDGFVIARMLLERGYHVDVYVIESTTRSKDNKINLDKLVDQYPNCLHQVNDTVNIIEAYVVFIDAIFGIGLNRPVEGVEKKVINWLNSFKNVKVSIDIPSGFFADLYMPGETSVQADFTLTFQQLKASFLFPESSESCGQIEVMAIGLDSAFEENEIVNSYIVSQELVQSYYKKRGPFSHKGLYGHVLVICGGHGKMGAAILATNACVRSGAGLVTVCVPPSENNIIQIAIPEAMTEIRSEVNVLLSTKKFDIICIGCGLGMGSEETLLLGEILAIQNESLLLDADALTILSYQKWLSKLPVNSILTPHPKEFDRLFGLSINSFERNKTQIAMSIRHNIFIVLKGRYTSITTPDGDCYFNLTGNPGMSKGGSGDVLSGIIAGLYAQYHDMKKAAIMGVYLHGLAGDIASRKFSQESMTPSDTIDCLGEAFLQTFYEIS